ncbi:MAG: hypothetical protein COT74_09270 [Bdellovibrionales bacterium CG10_big_fil_rev_8_21_14_0_10_45_34]|nr:MAG: hypothetical protein COT74_09270 [Bdellovibrionales bacterium CG10_big_fil_rev_8_21_14_0_10_45_34]
MKRAKKIANKRANEKALSSRRSDIQLVYLVFIILSLLFSQTSEARKLKKLVRLASIAANDFEVRQGLKLNFHYLFNHQFAETIINHGEFFPDNVITAEDLNYKFQPLSAPGMVLTQMNGYHHLSNANFSEAPACVKSEPMFAISGSMPGFQLYEVGGVQVGYGFPNSSVLDSAAVGAKFSKADGKLNLIAKQSYNNNFFEVGSHGVTSMSVNLNGSVSLRGFTFAVPQVYFDGHLNKIGSQLASGALNRLAVGVETHFQNTPYLAKTGHAWYTHVSYIERDPVDPNRIYLHLNKGQKLGLQPDDELTVLNVQHTWKGEPCRSEYLSFVPTVSAGFVKISDSDYPLGSNDIRTLLRRDTGSGDVMPQVGSIVVVRRLAPSI